MRVGATYLIEYKGRIVTLYAGQSQQKEWPHSWTDKWYVNYNRVTDYDGENIVEFEELTEEEAHQLIKNSSI